MNTYEQLLSEIEKADAIADTLVSKSENLTDVILSEIDLDKTFTENKAVINDVIAEQEIVSGLDELLQDLGTAIVLSLPFLESIVVTKTLVQKSLNYVLPDSNVTVNDMIDTTKSQYKRSVTNLVNQATDGDWTHAKLKKELKKTQERLDRNIRTIVNTASTAVINQVKVRMYDRNSNIDRVLFVAVMDSRTTKFICRPKHGRVYKKGTAPVPPLHFNCRSQLVAVYKNYKKSDIDNILSQFN